MTISQKGLAYLSQQKGQPWWKFISADTGLIIPFADRHSDRVAVATRQGNALLMALHMGANVTEWVFLEEPLIPLKSTLSDQEDGDKEDDWSEGIDYFEFFDNEVEISPPKEYAEAVFDDADLEGIDLFDANTETPNALLSAVRADTYNRAEAMGEIIIDQQNKKLFFFPKREVAERVERAGKVFNSAFTQSVGILVSESKSILIYHARCDGMMWTDIGNKNDQRLAHIFSAYCSPYDNFSQRDCHAALIVYNEKNFRDVLFDTKKKRRTKTAMEKCFQSFHLVPLSPDGTALLHQIATTDINAFCQSVLLDDLKAIKTEGMFAKPCPYSVNGIPVFNGIPMEMNSILLMHYYLTENYHSRPDKPPFIILAYHWQTEFYAHIWGDLLEGVLGFLYID